MKRLGTPCENCGIRPGTVQWVGEGGMLAVTHGWYSMWCERCVLEAQLAYARRRAAEIPELTKKLAALAPNDGGLHDGSDTGLP